MDITPWLDQYGLVCQKNPDGTLDGGDSPMKTSFYYIGTWLGTNFKSSKGFLDAIANIRKLPGQYFRNPVKWNDPADMSRDQYFPLATALKLFQSDDLAADIEARWLTNWNRAANGDLIGPDVWATLTGMNARKTVWDYFKWILTWPLILLADLVLIVGVIVRCVESKDPGDVGDDLNLTLMLIMRRMFNPSPGEWVARYLYLGFRKPSYGSYFDPSQPNESDSAVQTSFALDTGHKAMKYHPVIGAWKWYFRPSTGAPPLDQLWVPLVQTLLIDE